MIYFTPFGEDVSISRRRDAGAQRGSRGAGGLCQPPFQKIHLLKRLPEGLHPPSPTPFPGPRILSSGGENLISRYREEEEESLSVPTLILMPYLD